MKIDSKLIIEKYGLNISRLAHRMIEDREIAKDATQEVWYEIIKSIDTFKGDSEISTWIYTIAKRTIQRYLRNERLISSFDIEQCIAKGQIKYDDSDDKKEEWIKDNCDKCITAFCHCLTTDARLIFLFRDNLELSYKQISNIMDMTEENVRKTSSRSFKKIQNYFNNNCPILNPHGKCGCRIREQIISIDFDEKYAQLRKASLLLDFCNKFDLELPRKNYWIKYLNEVVTN